MLRTTGLVLLAIVACENDHDHSPVRHEQLTSTAPQGSLVSALESIAAAKGKKLNSAQRQALLRECERGPGPVSSGPPAKYVPDTIAGKKLAPSVRDYLARRPQAEVDHLVRSAETTRAEFMMAVNEHVTLREMYELMSDFALVCHQFKFPSPAIGE